MKKWKLFLLTMATSILAVAAPAMAAGIYFCRVRYGNRQWTGKWVVLKEE